MNGENSLCLFNYSIPTAEWDVEMATKNDACKNLEGKGRGLFQGINVRIRLNNHENLKSQYPITQLGFEPDISRVISSVTATSTF
jgi:hypothetical protein